jgi:hypothetical protein
MWELLETCKAPEIVELPRNRDSESRVAVWLRSSNQLEGKIGPSEEPVMKLSSEKLGTVLEQIDAKVIPADHPSLPKLRKVFGDHTFLVDDSGLTIIQPLDQQPQTGGLVKIARWDDADPPHLVAHTPEQTNVLIKLESAH